MFLCGEPFSFGYSYSRYPLVFVLVVFYLVKVIDYICTVIILYSKHIFYFRNIVRGGVDKARR